ncbi:histone-fold-containing protein [Coprinopsis marcescibilis]|uniref:Histone-fold-containing protein n=1 Tax=Coprinopsis marcescibilis TaxID=230819 RepID=A0A5C3KR67_COPMA|nr:histone-fold-containing protein [Coprinopsis marcescibilis]
MSAQQQPYVQSGEPLDGFLRNFWQRQVDTAEQETPDYRHPPLPLARIKKVMKSDPDVKMIAADAPILFCKACEIFISEITARAFIIADSNKRRTLSRSDIAKAISKSDQFDFLIDVVPRDDLPFPGASNATKKGQNLVSARPGDDPGNSPTMMTDGTSPEDASNQGGAIADQLESLLSGPAPAPSSRPSPQSHIDQQHS